MQVRRIRLAYQGMRRKVQLYPFGLALLVISTYHMFKDSITADVEVQPTTSPQTPQTTFSEEPHESALSQDAPWQLFDAGSLWDISKKTPQTGLLGDKHDDLLEAVDAAVERLNGRAAAADGGRPLPYKTKDLLDGRYRHLACCGSEYVLNFSSRQPGRLETVRLRRPVGRLSTTDSASAAVDIPVRLVVPYYLRGDVFGKFLANVARLMLVEREPLQLVVVFYWFGTPNATRHEVARDRDRVLRTLGQLNRRAGRQVARLLEVKSKFSRGHALLRGADADGGNNDDDDVLLFFCDVDMFIDRGALRRCRSNTAPGRSVYYPVVFSTFNPARRAQAWGKPRVSLWEEHPVQPDVGFWRDFGYGMTCQYRSDFRRVAKDVLVSHNWGGEDVKLFHSHRQSGIEIVRAPDPGMVHVHHMSRCNHGPVSGVEVDGCLRSQMKTEASADTWARWILRQRQGQLQLTDGPSGAGADDSHSEKKILDKSCDKCVLSSLELIAN